MLPIVKQPTYTVKTKELGAVKFRPFVNSEHKALLTTVDLGDEMSSFNTIVDIVKTCTFGALDVESLPPHMLEFIFLQSYIKSVENKINGSYECKAKLSPEKLAKRKEELEKVNSELDDDGEVIERVAQPKTRGVISDTCDTKFNLVVPIENAQIKYSDTYENDRVIDIDGVNKIVLKIPSVSIQVQLDEMIRDEPNTKNIDATFLYHGVDYIETVNGKLTSKDFTLDEFITWYDELHVTTTAKITQFYSTVPKLFLSQEIVCPSCGNKETIEFSGLKSFFS